MFKMLNAINRLLIRAIVAWYRLCGWGMFNAGDILQGQMPFIAGFVVRDMRVIAINGDAGDAAELLYISDPEGITKANLRVKIKEAMVQCTARRGYHIVP